MMVIVWRMDVRYWQPILIHLYSPAASNTTAFPTVGNQGQDLL